MESFLIDLTLSVVYRMNTHRCVFIVLTEHWLTKDIISSSRPIMFCYAANFCKSNQIRGGTCIFVNNKLKSRQYDRIV